jgi:hypothetical protein
MEFAGLRNPFMAEGQQPEGYALPTSRDVAQARGEVATRADGTAIRRNIAEGL